MNVRYRVTLTQYERNELGALLGGGKHPARKLKRAQLVTWTTRRSVGRIVIRHLGYTTGIRQRWTALK